MTNSQPLCGIDFGTSNSTLAVYQNTQVNLIPLENGKGIIPSVLFFEGNGNVLYGREAIKAYIDGEDGRLMRGLKSVLGTSLMSEKTLVGKKNLSFEDILTNYIGHLKNKAEQALKQPLSHVVMGRPVHFHDNNPDADTLSQGILGRIARNVGFTEVHFQFEPIAAAYAHEQTLTSEETALVVDLGGGTSDFSIIRLSPNRVNKISRADDILSTAGIRVGGTNFDRNFSISSFMGHFGLGTEYRSEFEKEKLLAVPSKVYFDLSDWPFIHQAQSEKAIRETKTILRTALDRQKIERLLALQEEQLGHALLQIVEQAKIDLTLNDIVLSDLEDIGFDFDIPTNRQDLESSIHDLIDRIRKTMDEALLLANCKKEDITFIILTGGSSELPIINALIQSEFPNAHISKDDKFGSVGRGLAYNAAQIYG